MRQCLYTAFSQNGDYMKCKHYIVNKLHPLPPGYYPADLVKCSIPFDCAGFSQKKCICAIADHHLEKLYLAALEDGIRIYGISAFRSYQRQEEIYLDSIKTKGAEHTARYIAPPGYSEHQTGLAIDVSCEAVNFELTEEFADTPEGIWLAKYAHQFDFRLSYPKDNTEGYAYEPWHICYACKDARFYV